MKEATRFVGLDVHAQSIAVAVAESGRKGEVRSLGQIPNRLEAVRKLIQKLGGPKGLQICYEAGPTGYALYWQLTKLGVQCEVIGRELLGFVWAIATHVEHAHLEKKEDTKRAAA